MATKSKSYPLEIDALNIYTDGSSLPKPRRGGAGMVFVITDQDGNIILEEDEQIPGERGATNNRMELMASVISLKHARQFQEKHDFGKVCVFTDSLYVRDGYRRLPAMASRRWMKVGGAPIEHTDLWKQMVTHVRALNCRVEIEWVKGHAGNPYNTAADKLAKKSAREPSISIRGPARLRRKKSPNKTKRGSVAMLGQRLTIRIIQEEPVRGHKEVTRYRYEVMSKRSKFYQCVDMIYSNLQMRAGHTYRVVLNKEQENPRVLSVLEEVA